MNAEIITVGTELLLFAHSNASADFINEELGKLGIKVICRVRVGDNLEDIESVVRSAGRRVNLIIVTGGLSFSENDLTREAIARAVGKEMKIDQDLLEKIKKKCVSRGLDLPEGGERIAMLPEEAEPLENKMGIVPGIFLKHRKLLIVCLPGSMREIEAILHSSFLQKMKPYIKETTFFKRTYRIYGMSEPEVDAQVKDLYKMEGCSVTTLSSLGQVEVDIMIEGGSRTQIDKTVSKVESELRKRFGMNLYGEDSDTLESVIGTILTERRLTLSVAESCTGGFLAQKITDIPGSSKYFKGGIVTYTDDAKKKLLDIPEKEIKDFGAISQETARLMASNVRNRTQTELALSVTGIAGPEGGTIDKPVGLVFIGIADRESVVVEKRTFSGDRQQVRQMAVQAALDLLRRKLLSGK